MGEQRRHQPGGAPQPHHWAPPGVHDLVAQLDDADGLRREEARRRLVKLGSAVVEPLVEVLERGTGQARWEAARALRDIADPAAAPALAQALEDPRFDVRWVAAEGLLGMGGAALPVVLDALVARSKSAWVREGASHVLHGLARRPPYADLLAPVIAALEHEEPALAASEAAHEARQRLACQAHG